MKDMMFSSFSVLLLLPILSKVAVMCQVLVFNEFYLIPLIVLDYGTYTFSVLIGNSKGRNAIKYFWCFSYFTISVLKPSYTTYHIENKKENNQYMWHVAVFINR